MMPQARNNSSYKYIRCPTASSSKPFSMLQHLPAWPPALAGLRKNRQRKLDRRPQRQCHDYVKSTIVMSAAIALKQCPGDKKSYQKTSEFIYSIASVALWLVALCLTLWLSLPKNYLSCFLSGDDLRPPVEAYQADYAKYQNTRKKEQSCLTGSKRKTKSMSRPNKTLRTPTTPSSSTTGYTKMRRSRRPANQSSLTSTSPAPCKNKAS